MLASDDYKYYSIGLFLKTQIIFLQRQLFKIDDRDQ